MGGSIDYNYYHQDSLRMTLKTIVESSEDEEEEFQGIIETSVFYPSRISIRIYLRIHLLLLELSILNIYSITIIITIEENKWINDEQICVDKSLDQIKSSDKEKILDQFNSKSHFATIYIKLVIFYTQPRSSLECDIVIDSLLAIIILRN